MGHKWTFKALATTGLLIWLGFMLAPVVMAAEAWHKIDHPTLDFLFVDASEPTLVYQQVHLEPVSVWYPSVEDSTADPAKALQQQADQQFKAAFHARGLMVVDQPTTQSLSVHIELIDLKAAPVTAELLEWARGFRFRVRPGHMTLVAELRDSNSGRVLVRLADLEDPSTDDVEAVWSSVTRALETWGEVIAANVAPLDNGGLSLADLRP